MHRPKKVASNIRKIIAEEILEIAKSLGMTMSITAIDVTPDLKEAIVWISVYGDKKEQAVQSIEDYLPRLNQLVAGKSTTKFTPRLQVKLDTSLDQVERINSLLNGKN